MIRPRSAKGRKSAERAPATTLTSFAATGTKLRFEYSPESFTSTELDFALEICEAVTDVWNPTVADKIILNLPATVEYATPNVHADQIEWMCTHLTRRDRIPGARALACAKFRMPLGRPHAETLRKAIQKLRGERDLRHQDQRLLSPSDDFSDRLEIDFSLAGPGDAVE